MSKPEIRISNPDGTVIDRQMNDKEYEVYLQDVEDEAKLLLGGI